MPWSTARRATSPISAATTSSCGRPLQQLPVRQRTALVLRFYLDLPEAEVARVLGVPTGTVKSWVHRGLARLRQRLGPEYRSEALLDTEVRP
jgi:DNA-directed RNA polymerase specialized sigma24 family protein